MKKLSPSRRHQLERNMPVYAVVFVAVALLLFGIAWIIISVSLHKTNPELIADKSVFICTYGEETVKIKTDEVIIDGEIYVDMTRLSRLCGLTASGDDSTMRYTAENGDYVIFTRYSEEDKAAEEKPRAVVCGVSTVMDFPAYIENGSCRVPAEFLKSITDGVDFEMDIKRYIMTVRKEELPTSTKLEPAYEKTGFTLKGSTPLPKLLVFSANLGGYEKYMNPSDSASYLGIISKTHTVGVDYTPENLTSLPASFCNGKDIQLSLYACKALEAMMTEMYALGYTDIKATSGFRSYEYQQGLYNTYISQEMSKNSALTEAEAKNIVSTYSADPGTSEHHSGLAADLISTKMTELDESFAQLEVYGWLCENAWKFGFILRYPEGKTDKTGYDFEPWHYRYIGRETAKKIHDANITLEEYLGS